ncbi:MAG: hypothetical protein RLZZ380_530 [Actinomycetota bacterium]
MGSALASTAPLDSNLSWDKSETSRTLDYSCVSQIADQLPEAKTVDIMGLCYLTTVTHSRVETVSPSKVVSRIVAPVSSPIRSRLWEIEKFGVTYYEVTRGKFYYDLDQVWSTKLYRGYKGYHECQAAGSWGVTVIVDVMSCPTTYSNSGRTVIDRENYKVSVFLDGSPAYWVLAMSQLSNYDGSTYTRNY